MDYIQYKKAEEMYSDCRLLFKLDSRDKTFEKMNIENVEKMQQLLSDVGINLDVTGEDLVISIRPSTYHQKNLEVLDVIEHMLKMYRESVIILILFT